MSRTHKHVSTFIVIATIAAAMFGAQPRRATAADDWVDATTIIVTTLLDKIDPNDGFCSLREAMQRAFDNSLNNQLKNDCPQSTSGNTTIQVAIPGNIVISNAVDGGQLPNIRNIVTILGTVTIDASQANQILFDVESDGKLNFVNVNIKNAKWTAIDSRGELKIAGGKFENNSAGGAGGGAIRNDGTAIIAGATFINNKAVKKSAGEGAKDGGAIRSTWVLTVTGGIFTTNVSDGEGGAIKIQAGRMSIVDSTFTGNVTEGSFCASCYGAGGGAIATADSGNVYPFIIKRGIFNGNAALKGVGGAIFHKADTLMTITDSTFQGNHAGSPGNEALGGAIHNVADMIIKRSTFTANSVQGHGGAISTEASFNRTLTLRMVAFSGNNASGKGGAMASMSLSSSVAKIEAKGVQVTGNVAGDSGGGIYVQDSKYDKAEFRGSVWKNLPQNCKDGNSLDDNLPKPAESNPPIDSKGQNSFSDTSCDDDDDDEQDKETDAMNSDPMLEPPAKNGGVPGMLTQKPAVGSPLIDKVDPAQNDNDPDTQQDIRGMQRPMNGNGIGAIAFFDIGPFERDDASPKFSSLPVPLSTINLGNVGQGTPYNKTNALTVFNGGDGQLSLGATNVSGANAAEFVVAGLPSNVSANSSTLVGVQCTPAGAGNRTAALSFTTNDPTFPTVSYTLQCTGTAGPGFGANENAPGPLARTTTLGTPSNRSVTVKETGGSQLTLSNPQLISDPPGAITLQTAFPINIANGGADQNITFRCEATAIGIQTATFTFNTNDASKPTVSYNIVCTINKAADPFWGTHTSTSQGLAGTDGPYGIAISPDGKHVYVADQGDNRIAAYQVGVNDQLSFLANYNSGANQFIGPMQIAVSPDGANVYVTGRTSASIATFTRDADTGALTYVDTVRDGTGYGCTLSQNCAGTVAGMAGAYGIALSPDGKFIYVSSITDSSVVVFKRDESNGAPSSTALLGSGAFFVQRFQHASLAQAYGMSMSLDGANLYVTGYASGTTAGGLLALKRNPTTGELSHVQTLSGLDVANLAGVFRVIITPEGDFLYTASFNSDAVCIFKRDVTNGLLSAVGCVQNAANLNAASDLALMPDGKNVLATAFNGDNVAQLSRNQSSGTLTLRDTLFRDPIFGFPALDGARGIVVNPNGKAAYATGFADDSVVTLRFARPKPVLTAVSPASKPAGSTSVLLSVSGIDFSAESLVFVNGAARTTNFINDTLLTVNMPDSDFANAGDLNITVFTSVPGGGTSNAMKFTVLAPGAQPVPVIESMSVLGLVAGSNGGNIRVLGKDFANGAAVLFNGSPRPTTFVNSGELQATLSAADLAAVGPVIISVSNAPALQNFSAFNAEGVEVVDAIDVGTNKSNNAVLNVVAPNQNVQPSILQLSQNTINMLSPIDQLEVIINGNGFVLESVAMWNGEARPTQFISSNQLKMTLNAGDFTSSMIAAIKVMNLAPGGGESNVLNFFVLGPVPEVYYFRIRLPFVANQ